MIIHGKEREFLFSIGAYAELSEMCPEEDLSKIDKLFLERSIPVLMPTMAKMAVILNTAAEENAAFNGKESKDPLTIKEVMAIPASQWVELQTAIMEAFSQGNKVSVHIEENQKKTETAAK